MQHRVTDVDPEKRTGLCSICGPVRVKPKQRTATSNRYWACKRGQAPWGNDRSAFWRLSDAEREALKADQGGVCAICAEPRPLVVDHDHASDAVRGLLCVPCNSALGRFETKGWADAAAAYLAEPPNAKNAPGR